MANIDTADLWRYWQIADRIFTPCGILQHAETVPKPRRIDIYTIFSSRVLLHSAVRHSVDAPLDIHPILQVSEFPSAFPDLFLSFPPGKPEFHPVPAYIDSLTGLKSCRRIKTHFNNFQPSRQTNTSSPLRNINYCDRPINIMAAITDWFSCMVHSSCQSSWTTVRRWMIIKTRSDVKYKVIPNFMNHFHSLTPFLNNVFQNINAHLLQNTSTDLRNLPLIFSLRCSPNFLFVLQLQYGTKRMKTYNIARRSDAIFRNYEAFVIYVAVDNVCSTILSLH